MHLNNHSRRRLWLGENDDPISVAMLSTTLRVRNLAGLPGIALRPHQRQEAAPCVLQLLVHEEPDLLSTA